MKKRKVVTCSKIKEFIKLSPTFIDGECDFWQENVNTQFQSKINRTDFGVLRGDGSVSLIKCLI